MSEANEAVVDSSVQAERRRSAAQGSTARIKSWDGPTVVLTVFGLLLTSMAGVGGMLLINTLNELQDSIQVLDNRIQALDDRMESRFKSLEEKVAANGERLAHIEGRLGISGDSSAHRPSDAASPSNQQIGSKAVPGGPDSWQPAVASSSNRRVPSKLLSVHFEALR